MHEVIKLKNGVRIIYEKMPSVRSAAVGIFIGVGSRFESPAENGCAHFIEHMLFKSTTEHSAAELAYITDSVGGQINAYTTREHTCFYAKVLDDHLVKAIDLLCEMFFKCAFDEAETESERGVITEEIGMYEDTPDDACYERLISRCFRGALGRPVLGTVKTLKDMTGESLRAYKDSHYTAGNIVISLCGSFSDSHLRLLEERFGSLPASPRSKTKRAAYTSHVSLRKKKLEQNQFCIAFPSVSLADDDRFAMNLLSTALGGGVSSRLFQNIREKHGLCYSIYSFQSGFVDTGLLSVATAVSKDTEEKTLRLIGRELDSLLQDGITDDELDRAREQARSSLLMGLESTSSRMLKLGNSLISIDNCIGTDELLERYASITREDILSLARRYIDFDKLSLSALGRTGDGERYMNALLEH